MAAGLYGRQFEFDLVGELLLRNVDRKGHDDGRPPILVIEAAAACGKTVLLDELSRQCGSTVPSAYVDLEAIDSELGDNPIPQLLATIAFELSRRCRLYGSLKFDRLVVGLLALNLPVNRLDGHEARRQMEELLRQRRGLPALTRVLGQFANEALALLPVPYTPSADLVGSGAAWIVDRLSAWSPTRRHMLGRFQEWYGHQDRDEGLDPVAVLIDLSSPSHNRPDHDNRYRVNGLLWRAFLADLRDNFNRGKHFEDWTLRPLLLLDNADTQLGIDFLHRIVQPPASGVETAAPLTIVASSRGGLLGKLAKGARATVRDVIQLGEVKPLDPRIAWLRRRLPLFTAEDVRTLVGKLNVPGGTHRGASIVVRQLAGGHPHGTYALLEAIANEGEALVEPEKLLESEHDGETVEDALYCRLFAGINGDALKLMITCSAARDQAQAVALASQCDSSYRTELPVLLAGLWDTCPENRMTLYRLLLLRKLARRPDTRPDSWQAVHERLRESATRQKDGFAIELYHTLALGGVDKVVAALDAHLGETTLSDWLDLLDGITAAPRKLGEPTPHIAPEHEYVHRLVVGLWTAADPVCRLHRSVLYWRIAEAYRELTEHVGDESRDSDALLRIIDLIKHYEQLAQQWQRMVRRSK